MIKRYLTIISIVLLASFELRAQPAKLRIMCYASEPWFFMGEDGAVNGVAAEQASMLAKEAGLTPGFVELPWTRAIEYMKRGQVDMMLTLSRTPERETFIHYLGIHAYAQKVLGIQRDRAGLILQTLDDMAKDDLLWGIRQDMFYSEAFNARLVVDPRFAAHFELQAKQALNLDKVRFGRLTGLIGDATALKYVLSKHAREYSGIVLKEVPFFKPDPVWIGVSRKLPNETIRRLQAAFDRLERRGAFAKALKKWNVAPGK